MKALSNNSRIIIPFVPTLSHLSSVKISVSLFNDFDERTLRYAIFKVENRIPLSCSENCISPRLMEVNRAHERLLFIPAHLRKAVFDIVRDMEYEINAWQYRHSDIPEVNAGPCTVYLRPDGRINIKKTAQQLLLNTNIDIRKRFALACRYCFQESIQNLWTEMELSGETENLDYSIDSTEGFWVEWIRNESRVPWRQAALEFFDDPYKRKLSGRFSDFFTSLKPAERKKFLLTLDFLDADDLMLCLYSLTIEEEHLILQQCPLTMLRGYLEWPYQGLFLEVAGKVLNYITEAQFHDLLSYFFVFKEHSKNFYCELFANLWTRVPVRLRESVSPYFKERVELWLNEFRKKRKAHFDEQSNKKRVKIDTD